MTDTAGLDLISTAVLLLKRDHWDRLRQPAAENLFAQSRRQLVELPVLVTSCATLTAWRPPSNSRSPIAPATPSRNLNCTSPARPPARMAPRACWSTALPASSTAWPRRAATDRRVPPHRPAAENRARGKDRRAESGQPRAGAQFGPRNQEPARRHSWRCAVARRRVE